ncbi:hypothetical protein BDR22DRAFT_893790 [Usnea florida]
MAVASNPNDTLFLAASLPNERDWGDLISQNIFAVSTQSRWHPFGDTFDFVKYTKDTEEGFRWFTTKAAELQSLVSQAPFSKPVVIVADIQEVIDMATRRTKEFDRGGFLTG